MPMFSFACEDCGELFETWVRSSSAIDEVECPTCESDKVQKQLSRVARMKVGSSVGSSAGSSASAASCSPGGG